MGNRLRFYLAFRLVCLLFVTHKSFSIYHNHLSLFLFPVFHKLLCLCSPQSAGPVWLRKFMLPRLFSKGRNGGPPLELSKQNTLLQSGPCETLIFFLILADPSYM